MATKTQPALKEWNTIAETAAYLSCSPDTIRKRIKDGLLAYSQPVPGGAIRISAVAIEKMMENNQH
jgi:excisionase family DNA binding protein